jgi:hypothetical protein
MPKDRFLFQRCPERIEYITDTKSGRPSNSWRGLVPLKSTRSGVEVLFGKASWSHGSTFIYETPCGRLDVVYSRGHCELTDAQRWNVPQDVVIRMEFAPRHAILVRDLKIGSKNYVRAQQPHPENWVDYQNKQDGIQITALLSPQGDTVAVIAYQPTKQQEELLLCKTQPNVTQNGWRSIVPLETSRLQVEKILSSPIEPCGSQCSYKSGDDRIFIRYSGEPCSQDYPWRIPVETVVEMSLYQAKAPKVSELRLDRRKFKKTNDPELQVYYWYEDEAQGISYSVSKNGRVTGTHWIGSANDDRKLRCSIQPLKH